MWAVDQSEIHKSRCLSVSVLNGTAYDGVNTADKWDTLYERKKDYGALYWARGQLI